ncbi:E3 ubiquitin-protein ligase CHFR [Elysia marginata]|uniref:E3 ubiquitin-protein ligase CHFR n=1 Tax=Elysia marginata TaxID=1093978 RepID=A0AAV4EES4_9GAST|nr:E3 ubiquitin-protein ligase CHFR [Elysia marginata]
MSSDATESWAQLVCTTDIDTPPALICKDKFHIGRNSCCDISHAGNKLVSGNHCYIERDHKGKVWLYDTSTNGTLLNLKIKLSKGECRQINHGDEFHLVHKKDNSDEDIGYMFQDLKALEAETSSDFEETQEYEYDQRTAAEENATLADEYANVTPTQCSAGKRKAPLEEARSPNKKPKSEEKSEPEENINLETCATKLTTSATPTSTAAGDTISASTSKANNPPSPEDPKPSTSGNDSANTASKAKEPEEDAIAETLMCIICQDILHDCISLQPCMHSFCSGCYSEWMELSQECPSCRVKVDRINKNHIVNNLVEAYLKLNPDKIRPAEDIDALEAKNKITRDMLYPVNQQVGSLQGSQTVYSDSDDNSDEENHNDENEDYDDEDDDDEEEEEEDNLAVRNHNPNQLLVNAFGVPLFGGIPVGRPAPPPVCRQCPQYNPAHDMNAIAAAAGAGALCYRSFCHAYWGCYRVTCNGCLGKLKDMNFGKGCLAGLILNNAYESMIFKNYLEAKGLSVRDVLAVCLAKMVNREYTCQDEARITSLNGINTPICFTCGLKNFQDLAYCYRRDIAHEDLPAEVTARPDCHWGKNCRTQKNKPDHAKRFNHICEQTRIT